MELSALPEELRALVKKQLDSGRYESVDELVCEAIRVHCEQEAYLGANAEQFRERISRGVAQADRGQVRDGRESMDDVQRRMTERRRNGGG